MNKKTAFQCQITLSPFCTVKLKHPTCRNKNEEHFRSSLSVSSCYSSCFSVTRQFVSGALGKRWKRASSWPRCTHGKRGFKASNLWRARCQRFWWINETIGPVSFALRLSLTLQKRADRFEFPRVFGPKKTYASWTDGLRRAAETFPRPKRI